MSSVSMVPPTPQSGESDFEHQSGTCSLPALAALATLPSGATTAQLSRWAAERKEAPPGQVSNEKFDRAFLVGRNLIPNLQETTKKGRIKHT